MQIISFFLLRRKPARLSLFEVLDANLAAGYLKYTWVTP